MDSHTEFDAPEIVWRVRRTFEREFESVRHKFSCVSLAYSEAKEDQRQRVWNPGVYVWTDGKVVVKVGRSLSNARMRALEHIPADTGGRCGAMSTNESARLILFTLDPEDSHWAAALEIYLERQLNPAVPSKREG